MHGMQRFSQVWRGTVGQEQARGWSTPSLIPSFHQSATSQRSSALTTRRKSPPPVPSVFCAEPLTLHQAATEHFHTLKSSISCISLPRLTHIAAQIKQNSTLLAYGDKGGFKSSRHAGHHHLATYQQVLRRGNVTDYVLGCAYFTYRRHGQR